MRPPAENSSKLDRPSRVETTVAAWLRVGVIASVGIILAGLIVSLVRNPEYLTDPDAYGQLTSPGAAFPHTAEDLLAELIEFRGRALITLGVLLLIATPVVRVGLSLRAYLHERDWIYTTITALVLAALAISFAVGAIP